MRGAPVPLVAAGAVSGIIPAYAGSTCQGPRSRSRTWDHPRVCGEHLVSAEFFDHSVGSSPRMRGALGERTVYVLGRRIIPAYAGSTRLQLTPAFGCEDHPRVCGEHRRLCHAYLHVSGSSPRMRGALYTYETDVPSKGIIPAYAGSTPDTRRPLAPCRDHPRVCGEHDNIQEDSETSTGSSPRMRGALRAVRVELQRIGIIPAYAGSTW